MFILQMAGFPGSGKSTLAKEISKYIDIVILDRDIIKSSMIESGVDDNIVANASYGVVFELCRFYLSLGKNVIIDTPCYYNESLINGLSIAQEYDVEYKYIECRIESLEEINNRLKTRNKLISQIEFIKEEDFNRSLNRSKKPDNLRYLVVDSSRDISSYIDRVLAYLNNEEIRIK